MPTSLKTRLSRRREITFHVKGRRSGRYHAIPVWFVWDGEKVYLLPGYGSDTQWYKNVRENPAIRIAAGDVEARFTAAPVTDRKGVSTIVKKFRGKYGDDGVKLYGKLDVAVIAEPK